MPGLMRRESRPLETTDVFERFDRMFDEWSSVMPRLSERLGIPIVEDDGGTARFLRVDEFRDGDDIVVRAELPGIDPERDVTITLSDHHLHLAAERRIEEETEDRGFVRRELRYGRFSRDLPLPETVADAEVAASYKDGILEVRIHAPEGERRTIPIERG